ncbi:class I SAM-dependent methyltransferase [Legionella micdadei]|uniref:Methyltransferase domain-containing protein n=1 Tax=Legionella micdadei TaxID=451 RepID=A0A098GD14_LEGMI|nr:class I SAM-dependent methyltransferase [Legionella micdadei]ARG98445.1 SAM-dependent methyltransferase [Legionella micdadei]KTD30344.1 putative Methyltransferase [Legionella micdadei]CEG59867.1 putative methyltransferase [Legionella micdadei]SCY52383.1 Methyltransferase domain-containing protein [Legionella micdadei]
MSQTKQLLSFARHGDFAHPGEVEAIQLAMAPIEKNPSQRLLDVGCGLGGTAHYLHQRGWGEITGIDLDSELIQYAKKHYPDICFIHGNVLQSEQLLSQRFNVIYCFSSFFCFASQVNALRQFSRMAEKGCNLMIFDYSRPNTTAIANPFSWSKTASRFNPIYLPELKEQLAEAGWKFKASLDLSRQFEHWYIQLLHHFDAKREAIAERFDLTLFQQMYKGYEQLLTDIREHKIGGMAVYATH